MIKNCPKCKSENTKPEETTMMQSLFSTVFKTNRCQDCNALFDPKTGAINPNASNPLVRIMEIVFMLFILIAFGFFFRLLL